MKSTRQRNLNLKVPGGDSGLGVPDVCPESRVGAESKRERYRLGIRRNQGRSEGLEAMLRRSHGEVH